MQYANKKAKNTNTMSTGGLRVMLQIKLNTTKIDNIFCDRCSVNQIYQFFSDFHFF